MREIKFKAWSNHTKQFMKLYHIMYPFKWENGVIVANSSDEAELTMLQYTGIKDSKGVEIYEGDIVEISFMEGGKYLKRVRSKVKWHNGYGNVYDSPTYYCPEVIGNIYENPELDTTG